MDPIAQLFFILTGVPNTLLISVFAFFLGFALGVPLAFIRAYGGTIPRLIVDGYEKLARGVPVLVMMLFLYFGVGRYVPFFRDAFISSVVALGLRSGAHQSQIFRGAIRGIGGGQMMAARSLGLTKLQAIRHVILPQTFIAATPGLGVEYALLIKDSSLAFLLGVIEMMKKAEILMKATRSTVIPYFGAAFFYIMLTFPIATYLDKWGSRKKRELGI